MGQIMTSILGRFFYKTPLSIPVLDMRPTKMVFLVRTDLNMGKGKIASQVAHAAILLYQKSLKNNNPHLKYWLKCGQPKIVLKVSRECFNIMNNVYNEALYKKLTACRVCDSGKTQIQRGSFTVVGIGPNRIEDIDEITKDFKLL